MVIWIIGLSGAGKTTLAMETARLARQKGGTVAVLDGDVLRRVWGDQLGHNLEDRLKNAQRIHDLCRYLEGEKVNVIAPVLSVFQETRDANRRGLRDYYEVYIRCPKNILARRDSKGLYARAAKGEIELPGVNMRFDEPLSPDLVIDNCASQADLLAYAPLLADKLLGSDYSYVSRDLLREPENYFYAPFAGKEFVEAWLHNRQKNLEKWAEAACPRTCPDDLTETERELWHLATKSEEISESESVLIEGLMRRFEISKKLPATLQPPRFSCIRSGDCLSRPHAYAYLGAILAAYAMRDKNMRKLNCLLKINDILCSLPFMPASLFPFARKALKGELKAVSSWAQRRLAC